MSLRLGPRESARFIVQNSTGVTLNRNGVEKVAQMIHEKIVANQFGSSDFNAHEVHIKTNSEREAIDWIFLVDTLNFSFWSDDSEPFVVTYQGKTYTGYFAACACINRAIDQKITISDAIDMANVSEEQLAQIFRTDSGGTIPLLKERVAVLHEAGRVLLQRFGGSFLNCVEICERKAQKLIEMVVENFTSYQDFATFKGQEVSFLKRAQILVSDIYSCLHRRFPKTNFEDIRTLTMFADYRVPQVLAYLGVLEYSDEVMNELRSKKLLENGCELEVMLRGFSIYACDEIADRVESLRKQYERSNANVIMRTIYPVDVDMFLWTYRRSHAQDVEEKVPYHRVRCIYY